MMRMDTFRCPEGFALMERRGESDGRIMSEYSCIRPESARSFMERCGSSGEMQSVECRVHECPSGYMAMGSHSRDVASGREGFEFSCVLPQEEQSMPFSLGGLV